MVYAETLDYERLEEPYLGWSRIARKFAAQITEPWDREDLIQDIILELAKVAEKYRRDGRPLTKWGALTVARYRRLRFYHDKARWRKVYSESLDAPARDRNGESRVASIPAPAEANYSLVQDRLQESPEKTRQAVMEYIFREDGHRLSGYEWKLIRQFKTECREMV